MLKKLLLSSLVMILIMVGSSFISTSSVYANSWDCNASHNGFVANGKVIVGTNVGCSHIPDWIRLSLIVDGQNGFGCWDFASVNNSSSTRADVSCILPSGSYHVTATYTFQDADGRWEKTVSAGTYVVP